MATSLRHSLVFNTHMYRIMMIQDHLIHTRRGEKMWFVLSAMRSGIMLVNISGRRVEVERSIMYKGHRSWRVFED
jgi:hypothetical protein